MATRFLPIVAPRIIMRIGTRVAVYAGLLATAALTLLFGFGPDMIPSATPALAPGSAPVPISQPLEVLSKCRRRDLRIPGPAKPAVFVE